MRFYVKKSRIHQEIYKQQEVHKLMLVKDNVPAYHTALDALLLDVKMPEEPMELLYTTQIEQSEQCKRIMDDYHYAPQKGTVTLSYAYLRKEVEDHLEILKIRRNQKSMNAAAGQALVATGKNGKGKNGNGKGRGKRAAA